MKKGIIMVLTILFALAGCGLQYADKENAIETPTNVKKLYQFELGYSLDTIAVGLGEPNIKERTYVEYSNPPLVVGKNHGSANYFITRDKNFRTVDGIKIGSSIDEIEDSKKIDDLYLYNHEGKAWLYSYFDEGVKIAYKIDRDQVVEIAVGVATLNQIFNYNNKASENKEITDKDIILNSEYLTYNLKKATNKNNKKVLQEDFIEYASLGLVEKVPVPLGMKLLDVERKYGLPNNVSKIDEFRTEYWYKKFNCSFIAIGEEEENVESIKCPISLEIEQINKLPLTWSTKDKKIAVFDEYNLMFIQEESGKPVYTFFIINKRIDK